MFWENFLPNFLSDLAAGVILGFVLALYIENRQKIGERKKQREELLILVKKELMMNYESIDTRIEKLEREYIVEFPGLKDEYWSVMSNTGQLSSVIQDAQLMERLSKAYYLIKAIKFVEQQYYQVRSNARSLLRIEEQVAEITNPLRNDLINGYKTLRKYMELFLKKEDFKEIPYEKEDPTNIQFPDKKL